LPFLRICTLMSNFRLTFGRTFTMTFLRLLLTLGLGVTVLMVGG
jgi:hypothetical protein